MALKYSVKDSKIRFESDSKLECEMVATALAFASLYNGHDTFKIMQGKTVLDEVDAPSSIQRLREKIKLAKFNKRIPEYIEEDEFESYISYNLKKGATTVEICDKVKIIQKRHKDMRKL